MVCVPTFYDGHRAGEFFVPGSMRFYALMAWHVDFTSVFLFVQQDLSWKSWGGIFTGPLWTKTQSLLSWFDEDDQSISKFTEKESRSLAG